MVGFLFVPLWIWSFLSISVSFTLLFSPSLILSFSSSIFSLFPSFSPSLIPSPPSLPLFHPSFTPSPPSLPPPRLLPSFSAPSPSPCPLLQTPPSRHSQLDQEFVLVKKFVIFFFVFVVVPSSPVSISSWKEGQVLIYIFEGKRRNTRKRKKRMGYFIFW